MISNEAGIPNQFSTADLKIECARLAVKSGADETHRVIELAEALYRFVTSEQPRSEPC